MLRGRWLASIYSPVSNEHSPAGADSAENLTVAAFFPTQILGWSSRMPLKNAPQECPSRMPLRKIFEKQCLEMPY